MGKREELEEELADIRLQRRRNDESREKIQALRKRIGEMYEESIRSMDRSLSYGDMSPQDRMLLSEDRHEMFKDSLELDSEIDQALSAIDKKDLEAEDRLKSINDQLREIEEDSNDNEEDL